MEEKESKKHIKYTPDPVEHDLDLVKVDEAFSRFVVEIVEEQDRIIMQNIRHIGGTRYEHITIDRDKTLEALQTATAKKPTTVKDNVSTIYSCPVCSKWIDTVMTRPPKKPKYCSECGQKLDWTEVK